MRAMGKSKEKEKKKKKKKKTKKEESVEKMSKTAESNHLSDSLRDEDTFEGFFCRGRGEKKNFFFLFVFLFFFLFLDAAYLSSFGGGYHSDCG